MRIALVALSWTAAVSLSIYIVKVLTIGPIIYTISSERGWGVHSGDFWAFLPPLIALLVHRAVMRESRA